MSEPETTTGVKRTVTERSFNPFPGKTAKHEKTTISRLKEWLENNRKNGLGLTFEEYMTRIGYDKETVERVRQSALVALDSIAKERGEMQGAGLALSTLRPAEYAERPGFERALTGIGGQVNPYWYRDFGNLLLAAAGMENSVLAERRVHNALTMALITNFASTSVRTALPANLTAALFAGRLANKILDSFVPKEEIAAVLGFERGDFMDKRQKLYAKIKQAFSPESGQTREAAKALFKEYAYHALRQTVTEELGEDDVRVTVTDELRRLTDEEIERLLTAEKPEGLWEGLRFGGVHGEWATRSLASNVLNAAIETPFMFLHALFPELVAAEKGKQLNYLSALRESFQAIYGERFSWDNNKTRSYMLNLVRHLLIPDADGNGLANLLDVLGLYPTNTRDTWMHYGSGGVLKVFSPEGTLDTRMLTAAFSALGVMVETNEKGEYVAKMVQPLWDAYGDDIRRLANIKRDPGLRSALGDIKASVGQKAVKLFRMRAAPPKEAQTVERMVQQVVDALVDLNKVITPYNGGVILDLKAVEAVKGKYGLSGAMSGIYKAAKSVGKHIAGAYDEATGVVRLSLADIENNAEPLKRAFISLGQIPKNIQMKMGFTAASAVVDNYVGLSDEFLSEMRHMADDLFAVRELSRQALVGEAPRPLLRHFGVPANATPDMLQACFWSLFRNKAMQMFNR